MESAKYFRADLALYSVILQKAGIDINLIQNEEQFASLVEKLQQTQIEHVDKFPNLSQENVNAFIETIRNEWNISNGQIVSNSHIQPQSNQSFLNEVPLSEILNFSNKDKIESRQYSDEQTSQITEDILKNSEKSLSKEEAIQKVLNELGISEELLQYPYLNDSINNMINISMSNNPEIGDITTKDGLQKLIQQINQDFVIGDNYIAGKNSIDSAPDSQLVTEIYLDDNGLIHYNDTILNQNSDFASLNINQRIYQGGKNGNLDEVEQIYINKVAKAKDAEKIELRVQDAVGINAKEELQQINENTQQPGNIEDPSKEEELINSYDTFDILLEDINGAYKMIQETMKELGQMLQQKDETTKQQATNQDEGR